jgi:hypothetical protein
MARIVIHAGMPKTGSTSVQQWIARNSRRLRQEHDITVLVVAIGTDGTPAERVQVRPYESGSVNASRLIEYWVLLQRPRDIAVRFVDQLSNLADQYPIVLISGEGLSEAFWRVDEGFLEAFEQLGRAHDVQVAYYVRPQHTAIEAGWREAGYKLGADPATYVIQQSKRLHYLRTLDAVRQVAPHVRFEVRPFLPELLDGGSPVNDFVRRFLSINEDCEEYRNRGLPLQLVNALRRAPEGMFWSGKHESHPRRKMIALFDGLVIAESAKIRRSRLVLQEYCRRVFEPANRELIERLDWRIPHFVPPTPDELDGDWEISELNVLWAPEASEVELALLYRALSAALARGTAARERTP